MRCSLLQEVLKICSIKKIPSWKIDKPRYTTRLMRHGTTASFFSVCQNKYKVNDDIESAIFRPIMTKRFMTTKRRWRWSNRTRKFKRNFGLINCILITTGGTLYLINSISKKLSYNLRGPPSILGPEDIEHIYTCDPEDDYSILKRHLLPWWPEYLLLSCPKAWMLVEQTKSNDKETREAAIIKLANLSYLEDFEFNQLARNINKDVSVALAHSCGDPRLISCPLLSTGIKDTICFGSKFREILLRLPQDNLHACLNTYIEKALKSYHPTAEDIHESNLEGHTGFESDPAGSIVFSKKKMKEHQFLALCLQALLSHSRNDEGVETLLNQDVLDTLVIIAHKYSDNVDIMCLITKILANLACHENACTPFQNTGCLRILSECAHDHELRLATPARRALHNLDRSMPTPLLPSGIYQLHPDYRKSDQNFKCDVIFIHGLLGGAIRTWRRQDSAVDCESIDPSNENQQNGKSSKSAGWMSRFFAWKSKISMPYQGRIINNPDENKNPEMRKLNEDGTYTVSNEIIDDSKHKLSDPTQCWPRDWLPKDCPNARIIAVDYDSFVTHWSDVCPIESLDRSIAERSSTMLKKLLRAGVGERPIIWVTHSMGGLLLKNLLCSAEKSNSLKNKKIVEKTIGVVFCSVPHRGSEFAAMNMTGKLLFLPTLEVEELRSDSSYLRHLHEEFSALYEKRKFLVTTFTEIRETVNSIGLKFKLVPFSSADPGYGEFFPLDLDHMNICKPKSRDGFLYKRIVELIQKLVPESATNSKKNQKYKDPWRK